MNRAPPRRESHEFDVFLCYARADADSYAKPLLDAMRDSGLRVFVDVTDVAWGDVLRDGINRGLRGARALMPVVTERFFTPWANLELAAFVNMGRIVLPVVCISGHELQRKDGLLAALKYRRWADDPRAIAGEVVQRLALVAPVRDAEPDAVSSPVRFARPRRSATAQSPERWSVAPL